MLLNNDLIPMRVCLVAVHRIIQALYLVCSRPHEVILILLVELLLHYLKTAVFYLFSLCSAIALGATHEPLRSGAIAGLCLVVILVLVEIALRIVEILLLLLLLL